MSSRHPIPADGRPEIPHHLARPLRADFVLGRRPLEKCNGVRAALLSDRDAPSPSHRLRRVRFAGPRCFQNPADGKSFATIIDTISCHGVAGVMYGLVLRLTEMAIIAMNDPLSGVPCEPSTWRI